MDEADQMTQHMTQPGFRCPATPRSTFDLKNLGYYSFGALIVAIA